jgi:hypothetical protein
MASAADGGPDSGERRRQRALGAFRAELEHLDADEIQARLDSNRIRNEERRAIARQRLQSLRSGQAAAAANEDELEDEDEPVDNNEQIRERSAMQNAEAHEQTAGYGAEHEPAAAAAEHAAAEQEEGALDVPMARRIGRLVGMTAAVGGVVLAGALLIRR